MATQRSGVWWSLVAAAAAATAVTLSAQTPKPTFEVISVKHRGDQPPTPRAVAPNVFYRSSSTVAVLVQFAYNIGDFQLIGGPDWIRSDRFEVHAKAAEVVPPEQMRLMVQSLLEERFKLVVRKDHREMRIQSLGLARSDGRLGPKLEKCDDPANLPAPKPLRLPPNSVPFAARCRELPAIAASAAAVLGTAVVDRTGLTGLWSYEFVYFVAALPSATRPDLGNPENVPSFPIGLEESLGLKLEPGRGPVDVIVIESVQQPTEN